jgi:LysM repeat protein
MNTPSPLQPMGRLPQTGTGKSSFNLAVITIVALHVVFFGGLLIQGCRPEARDQQDPVLGQSTNTNLFPDSLAGLGQPYPDRTNLAGLDVPDATLSFTSAPPVRPTPTNYFSPPDTARTLPPPMTNSVIADMAEPPPILPGAASTEYRVVKGDTPSAIAKKHGITLEMLREANPEMKDRGLQIDQPLQIPPAPRRDLAAAASTGDASVKIHVVKAGETLTKIAKLESTTVKELRRFNNLKTDRIVVNQKLKIPPPPTNASGPGPRL